MYELNEHDPSSLKNHPSPYCPSWFVDALSDLGGRQLDGKPNLKVVWGQTERKFACGAYRIKYPTTFVAERQEYIFRLRNIETNELTFCSYGEFMDAKKVYSQADPNIKYIPEYKVKRQVEWIGVPRFFIEQYMPVTMMKDTPSNWELNRYNWWFNPETKRNEWTDINGPFPYGRYEHFLTVCENDGTRFGRYCPVTEDTLSIVREALQERDKYKSQPEVEFKNFLEKKEKGFQKNEQELSDEIADSLAPHVSRMYEQGIRFYNEGIDSRAKSKKKLSKSD